MQIEYDKWTFVRTLGGQQRAFEMFRQLGLRGRLKVQVHERQPDGTTVYRGREMSPLCCGGVEVPKGKRCPVCGELSE